jgi:glutamyl-tRNA reductase
MGHVSLVGVSHHTVALDVIGSFPRGEQLRGHLVSAAGTLRVEGLVAVSTCNRFELYASGPDPVSRTAAVRVLGQLSGGSPLSLTAALEMRTDHDAVQHLFNVAAGVDSRLVGEGEILTQVGAAATMAKAVGTLDTELASLFQRAVAAGRRARRVGGLRGNSRSIGVHAADAVHAGIGDITDRNVLVVGAGVIASRAVRRLEEHGARVMLCTRTPERPRPMLARRPLHGLDELPGLLRSADAVLCAVTSPEPLLTASMLRAATAGADKPLLVVDVGVPRTVESDPAARVIDLDALDLDWVEGARRNPARKAVASAGGDADAYRLWQVARDAAPLITQVLNGVEHALFEEARHRAIAPDDTSLKAARRVAGSLAHRAIVDIREHAAAGDWESARAVAAAFVSEDDQPSRVVRRLAKADCA